MHRGTGQRVRARGKEREGGGKAGAGAARRSDFLNNFGFASKKRTSRTHSLSVCRATKRCPGEPPAVLINGPAFFLRGFSQGRRIFCARVQTSPDAALHRRLVLASLSRAPLLLSPPPPPRRRSHKTLRVKKLLAVNARRNRPLPQWTRMKTGDQPRCVTSPGPPRGAPCWSVVGCGAGPAPARPTRHLAPLRPFCLPPLLCAATTTSARTGGRPSWAFEREFVVRGLLC
jgi:ribosomal protein L39E